MVFEGKGGQSLVVSEGKEGDPLWCSPRKLPLPYTFGGSTAWNTCGTSQAWFTRPPLKRIRVQYAVGAQVRECENKRIE